MQQVIINNKEKLDFGGREAYKSLRTNIQFSGEDVKVVAVTSCVPNEGKTSVSFQLALSMADAGKSVLLIDADMRKSVLVGRFKVSGANKGLSHFLAGQNNFDEVVSITETDKFHMVTTGPIPPNPSELLEGKRFKKMVEAVRGIYDFIIIDTPPLGSVIDCAVIAKECDGVVMVISQDMVSYKFAQKVKNQLEMSGAKILGVVLNKVARKGKGYYGKYYGKYYGSYYGHYEEEE